MTTRVGSARVVSTVGAARAPLAVGSTRRVLDVGVGITLPIEPEVLTGLYDAGLYDSAVYG